MAQVNRFFDKTTLVIYDKIIVNNEQSLSGTEKNFWSNLEAAEQNNRSIIAGLVDELHQNGILSLQDVGTIEQGYVSKTFHILSHFIDGFIGIDSYFYNLLDDSHWVPKKTIEFINQCPAGYWLIHLDCYAAGPKGTSLLH